MTHFSCFVLLFTFLSLQARCQSVQDYWTAPASPDGSTSLQNGKPYTIVWKSTLRDSFSTYCATCDMQQVDLWITTFHNGNYNYKIADGVDITTVFSYNWTEVNIPTAALSGESVWVFRFVPHGSKPNPQFDQQISSAAVNIVDPDESSTSSTTSSSTTSMTTTTSSPTTATSSPTDSTPSPAATSITSAPGPKSKAWIAGVVIGPLAGIALGAALVWYLLGKRGKDNMAHVQGGDRDQQPELKYTPTDIQPPVYHDHPTVEAPGSESVEPAELWHGNYKS